METKVLEILKSVLPTDAFIHVSKRKNVLGGGDYLRIAFAADNKGTGCATGNRPQQVSLCLDLTDLELTIQVYGGTGGQCLTTEPNMDDPKEKYLYCGRVVVPFRKPKKAEKNVLSAIKRFAENWLKLVSENKDRLKYSSIVDYDKFLQS